MVIVAECNTNGVQAMLKFCSRFHGIDKTHLLGYNDKLRVVLCFYRQSVVAIFQGKPKTTDKKGNGRSDVDARERQLFLGS